MASIEKKDAPKTKPAKAGKLKGGESPTDKGKGKPPPYKKIKGI
jgi:hypothetical protein